jgi:polysaccharide deacetylase family protein (PEP-CTERM system associated)
MAPPVAMAAEAAAQGPTGAPRAASRTAPAPPAPDVAAARRAAVFAALPDPLTFTVDVEELHPESSTARLERTTRRLLDLLEEAGGRGTFFVLGEAARRAPRLVREIARRGHELASHGERHRALGAETPEGFRADLAACKARIEDLAGAPVLGFRAPMFSLTTATAPWATAVLGELGFAYSSSVVPAWNFLHGYPGAPRRPFLWPSGVLELPCPLGRLGPLAMPFLGGMYLRYLPAWRLRQFARQAGAAPEGAFWTYCHPYDVDTAQGLRRYAGLGLGASLMLWLNRGRMEGRLRAVLAGRRSLPFAARLEAIRAAADRSFQPNWAAEVAAPGGVPRPAPG